MTTEAKKVCSSCKHRKPITEFERLERGGNVFYRNKCNTCRIFARKNREEKWPIDSRVRVYVPQNFSEGVRSFADCVEYAANQTGSDTILAHTVITYFFEELAKKVAQGKFVSVPNIGMFGTVPWTSEWGYEAGLTHSRVRFRANQAFQNFVKFTCPPNDVNYLRFSQYVDRGMAKRFKNWLSKDFNYFEEYRQRIVKQARQDTKRLKRRK